MSSFQIHNVFYISTETLSNLLKKNEKIDYSNLGLIIENKYPLCELLYSVTKRDKGGKRKLYVDPATYSFERKKLIDYILFDIVITYMQLGRRLFSISAEIKNYVKFIKWIDNEKYNIVENKTNAKNAYNAYVFYLKTSIRQGNYSPNYANSLQLSALKSLRSIYNDKEGQIGAGIDIISKDYKIQATPKTNDSDISYSFNFYFHLFNQIANFLLENKKYPFQLKLPNEDLWVLPYKLFYFISPSHKKQKIVSFNYDEGEVRSLKEVEDISTKKEFAKQYLENFLKNLESHNRTFNSDARLYLGSIAVQAYFIHFLNVTGMNDSVVATLPMMDDYEVIKTRQKYRTIKYRAGNKIIDFEISHHFIKYFQKYLKLRKFVLNGCKFDYLFFVGYDNKSKLSTKQKRGAFSSYINDKMINNIDPNLPKINSRQSRVNKTHYTIKKHGIIAASQMAQSSISTIISSYTGASNESSALELTDYFNELNKNLIIDEKECTNISVGQCSNIEHPKSSIELININVDCRQAEGCLFCEHYGCHADEIDIRKIYSLKFVIKECEYISNNEEHFTSVYGTVLKRIKDILSELKNHSSETKRIVQTIQEDVFENENLDKYWEFKLKTLLDMGVLR